MDILALLQPIQDQITATSLRQMSVIITAMLSMTGRITMLGLSRWAGKGGSYRTIQRFYNTVIPWAQVSWQFFCQFLFHKEDVYILAGDETVVSKAGKHTYGVDRFFAGLQQQVIPSVSFFVLSLINVKERSSYPMQMEQIVRSDAEKAANAIKKETKKAKAGKAKGKPGRPKGSTNKAKVEIELNPELQRIQKMVAGLLLRVSSTLRLTYLVMDGHFGNYPAFQMARQCQLHLISKLRWDAALCYAYEGVYKGRGPHPKYGERVDYQNIPDKYLKSTTIEDGIQIRTYQAQLLHADFPTPLNVVILVKTNLTTHSWAHVILFSSDLNLSAENLVDYYRLRFQIEFNFRDAKQYWGLEDFMNINQTGVTNAANLSLFMVNLSQVLMSEPRQTIPDFSVLDLKSFYRGCCYASELIKILPQKPNDILITQLFQKIVALGCIHPSKSPVFSP